MNDVTLTKEQFENEAFKYYLRTDKMYNYYDYQNWIVTEGLKLEQGIFKEVYLNEERKYVIPQEDTKNNILDDLDIPESSGGDEDEESEDDEGGEYYTEEELNNAVRQAVDDYFSEKKSGVDHTEDIKSGQTKIDDLISEYSGFAVDKGKTYAVWSGGSCDGCQALNGTVYEVSFFGMVDGDIPETHPNCKCELTILDTNFLPTKEIISLKKWEKDQKKPKPAGMIDLRKVTFPNNYTESRKLGEDKQKKKWDDMTKAEQEKAKIKELDKFMKSDKFKANLKAAEQMRDKTIAEKYLWMLNNFGTGDKYDIKHGKPEMEHVGNYNYGAMGRVAGLSELELKGGAGGYQVISGTSSPEFFYPWSWSYGDDPVDQGHIQDGINFINSGYGGTEEEGNFSNNPLLNML